MKNLINFKLAGLSMVVWLGISWFFRVIPVWDKVICFQAPCHLPWAAANWVNLKSFLFLVKSIDRMEASLGTMIVGWVIIWIVLVILKTGWEEVKK